MFVFLIISLRMFSDPRELARFPGPRKLCDLLPLLVLKTCRTYSLPYLLVLKTYFRGFCWSAVWHVTLLRSLFSQRPIIAYEAWTRLLLLTSLTPTRKYYESCFRWCNKRVKKVDQSHTAKKWHICLNLQFMFFPLFKIWVTSSLDWLC